MSRFRRPRAVAAGDASDSPAEALRGAARGDEAAFGRFYGLTSAMVYGIVLKVVRDPAMA